MRSEAASSDAPHRGFVFGEFKLDIDRAALLHNGDNVGLRPQSLDVLRQLVEHHGSLVRKEDLLEAVWGKTTVTDDSLTHCLIDIRKVLGDTQRKMIRTVPRRGFIFDLPVETISSAVRVGRQRHRAKLSSFIAAGVLVSIGAGYFLVHAFQPVPPPQAASTSADSRLENEATNLYLQGRFLFNRRASTDLDAAEKLFKQALELKPEFADAWANLAGIYAVRNFAGGEVDPEALPLLKHAAERAVELDPNLAAGWVRLAHYYAAIGDAPSADRHIQRAADAETEDPLLLAVMAGDFAAIGNFDRAVELQQRALALDPLSVVNRFNLSAYLLAAGRYNDALRESARAAQLSPTGDARLKVNVGFALIQLKQYERALALATSWPDSSQRDVVMVMAGLSLGREAVAAEALFRLRSSKSIESHRHRAELEAFCENIENSFLILTQLRDQFSGRLDGQQWRWQLLMIKVSPFLAPVRADPRWEGWLTETPPSLVARSR